MTLYIRSGSRFQVTTEAAMDLHDKLPAGTYTVKFNEMAGQFYLEAVEGFTVKGKVYGDTAEVTQRILSTFYDRSGSTGVLLAGEKGSGKTLQAKMLSLVAMTEGIPTIIINRPWCGEEFNAFMQTIEQPTVVIFDEFEKVYDRDDQEKMLTLLDGVYPSKKLFVLTSNDKYRINDHMTNRPGRLFYALDYKGLDNDFIMEYCADNLKQVDQAESICRVAMMFSQFNFDMLKALVEEMNRYGETAQQALKMLNAKPTMSSMATFDVDLKVAGVKVDKDELNEWRGNPLLGTVVLNYAEVGKDYEEDDYDMAVFELTSLKNIDSNAGRYEFENEKGDKLILSKQKIENSPTWIDFV